MGGGMSSVHCICLISILFSYSMYDKTRTTKKLLQCKYYVTYKYNNNNNNKGFYLSNKRDTSINRLSFTLLKCSSIHSSILVQVLKWSLRMRWQDGMADFLYWSVRAKLTWNVSLLLTSSTLSRFLFSGNILLLMGCFMAFRAKSRHLFSRRS